MTYTAWDLKEFAGDCGYDGPPFGWDGARRAALRASIDAHLFLAYGCARSDIENVLDSFGVLRDREVRQMGRFETRERVLQTYEEVVKEVPATVALT